MRGSLAHRVDGNHKEIVDGLRALPGVSVASTAALGGGFPDIAVGYAGNTYLFEIKDPAKPPSARRLTPDEEAWIAAWKGQVGVVMSVREVMTWIDFPA